MSDIGAIVHPGYAVTFWRRCRCGERFKASDRDAERVGTEASLLCPECRPTKCPRCQITMPVGNECWNCGACISCCPNEELCKEAPYEPDRGERED